MGQGCVMFGEKSRNQKKGGNSQISVLLQKWTCADPIFGVLIAEKSFFSYPMNYCKIDCLVLSIG